ncbi:hypothetical protein [Lentilactobacillus hilgardii]|uniref:hypothetical protein n=1 Tax=Lentilactobacillus hilgardii TaxID=1588 RepID=UPI0021A7FCEC|nr:hypothetical protein [Lentilactobacillus hilgardii]
MSNKCKLCGGTGRVYVDLGFGYTVGPCPQCNAAYRKRMEELTGSNKVQKAQKEVNRG